MGKRAKNKREAQNGDGTTGDAAEKSDDKAEAGENAWVDDGEDIMVNAARQLSYKKSEKKYFFFDGSKDIKKTALAFKPTHGVIDFDHLDLPSVYLGLFGGPTGSELPLALAKTFHTKLLPQFATYRGKWEADR